MIQGLGGNNGYNDYNDYNEHNDQIKKNETNDIRKTLFKPLSSESQYFIDHLNAQTKDDLAMKVFGKSEDADNTYCIWDEIDKSILPWRGGELITDNLKFKFCVYYVWWGNSQTYPIRLIKRLKEGTSIEGNNKTIYFWKLSNK